MAETGQPYAYTGGDPVNGTDPLGLCSTSGGTFLVSGACHWTSSSWVSQTENTLQGQEGGGFSITNGLKAVADYGAGIGDVAVSTVTLGHVHVAPPYCGFGWASDVGMGYGFVALAVLGGGAGSAEEVSDGAATVEEVEAEGQAAGDSETANTPRGLSRHGGIFSSEENAAGGTVYTSSGEISQSDFASMVNSGLMKGDVNIISGVHGYSDAMSVDRSLYLDDIDSFGQLEGVTVHNLPDLTPGEISDLLNGPGTTIGGFCNSGTCLAPFK